MLNFAVIGTGPITGRLIDAGREIPDFHLKAVYSRTMKKAEDYAEKYGAELAFDNLEKLAACNEVDAVYIASPNYCHASQSILMMSAGKHVLCEKPIASNLDEFHQMRLCLLENETVLLEAMRPVFSPGFDIIKKNLPRLGKIRRVSLCLCEHSKRYDSFMSGNEENVFNSELSTGALMDVGVYCVHSLAALFGMPSKILSSCMKLRNGADSAGTVLVEYNEMQGELLYSKSCTSYIPSQIQGEKGSITIDHIQNPQNVFLYLEDGRKETLDIPKISNDMSYELQEFIRLVQNRQQAEQWLMNSEIELAITDEVRRQQGIAFAMDR